MDDGDRLITELLRFVELLRRMGLSVGSGQALDATRTLALVDLSRRDDVYAALRAVLLDAHVHEPAFAAAFDRFWRGLAPLIEQFNAPIVGYAPATESRGHGEENGNAAQQVVKRVITLGGELDEDEAPDELGEEGEAAGQIVAYSASEALRQRDFAHLSPAELAEMRRLLSTMSFKPPMRRLRRTQPARHGALLALRRRGAGAAASPPQSAPAAHRPDLRRERLHGPLYPPAAALPARRYPGAGGRGDLCLRHPPDAHHPPVAPARPRPRARRGGARGDGLLGRDAYRRVHLHLQPALDTACAGARRHRHRHQRRLGPRRPGLAGRGDGPLAALVPPAGLAQPVAGPGGLPAADTRHDRGPALHRPVPAGA